MIFCKGQFAGNLPQIIEFYYLGKGILKMAPGNPDYWSPATRFDIRDLADPSEADECLQSPSQCGPNLRDIYCWKAHGSSAIAKHAGYVENVAIDFQKEREDNKPEEPSIRQILLQFTNLTRLRLKLHDNRYDYFYFIQHLPQGMLEIHLLCDTIINGGWLTPKDLLARKFLDLRKFSQLRALTLCGFIFEYGSLLGLERLINLKYLRLDYNRMSERHFDAITLLTKLEYLSLEKSQIDAKRVMQIGRANKNLKVLNIRGMIRNVMNVYLSGMKQLKILRYSHPTNIDLPPNLEYFDCSISDYTKDNRFHDLINTCPDLEAINITGCPYDSELISRIEDKLASRESCLELYLGKSEKSTEIISNFTSEYLQCLECPRDKYARLFDYDYFNGWYTPGEEEVTSDNVLPVRMPILDDSSPIDLLTDDCLVEIFLYLSIPERLKMEQVCERWKTVALKSWYTQKNLDVRDMIPHEDIDRLVPRCGPYIKDIYCYKSCGLCSLPTQLPNVRGLAIDFRNRPCECSTHIENMSWPSFNSILKQFSNLTRVMFEHFNLHVGHSFLDYLPETMKEIHVFNEGFTKFSEGVVTTRIDLSKFVHLRALTFIMYEIDNIVYNHHHELHIEGMDQLEKLNYLRLFGDMRFKHSEEPFKNVKNLEYLSLEQKMYSHFDIAALVKNNGNLKCVNISCILETEFLPSPVLEAICTLDKLQHFRLRGWYRSRRRANPGERPPAVNMTGMSSLEFFDYDSSGRISEASLQPIIANSPKLRVINIPMNSVPMIRRITEAVGKNSEVPVKIFVGFEGLELVKCLRDVPSHIVFDDIPHEHDRLFGIDYWGGWYKDE